MEERESRFWGKRGWLPEEGDVIQRHCPLVGCGQEFEGVNADEKLVEHMKYGKAHRKALVAPTLFIISTFLSTFLGAAF